MSEDVKAGSVPGSMNPKSAPRAGLKPLAAIAVVVSILAVAAAGIYLGPDSIRPPAARPMPATMSEYNTTHLSIPVSAVGSTAAYYTYNSSGTQIRLFVVKDRNGKVHAAFDACPDCFASRLGFHQQGDMIFDNRTNRSIPISAIGADTFGCHPVGLTCKIEGGRVMIPKAAVLSGAYLFRTPAGIAAVENYNLTTISIPLSSLGGTPAWYEYNISGARVRFLAALDGTGAVRTAFDECPMCYESHQGFRWEGNMLVENCCDMPFAVNAIAPGLTGCHPEYLPSHVEGNRVMISKSDLLAKSFMFCPECAPGAVADHNLTTVAIPLASVGANATWYDYTVSGAMVRFFIVTGSNGSVHAALDNCPKCYKKHAGFRQEGAAMVENCCNMPFPIDNITYAGCNLTGCHPAFINTTVENDLVIIRKSDLAAGIGLFKTEADTSGITPYNDTTVQLPLSYVNGTARWFEYNLTGTAMRLFVVADAKGAVHAALDNCPKCYKKHAGFRQEGAVMVENCCNMPFAIDNITAAGCNRTGCRPAFLPTIIDGPRILILIADLEAGRYLFQ